MVIKDVVASLIISVPGMGLLLLFVPGTLSADEAWGLRVCFLFLSPFSVVLWFIVLDRLVAHRRSRSPSSADLPVRLISSRGQVFLTPPEAESVNLVTEGLNNRVLAHAFSYVGSSPTASAGSAVLVP